MRMCQVRVEPRVGPKLSVNTQNQSKQKDSLFFSSSNCGRAYHEVMPLMIHFASIHKQVIEFLHEYSIPQVKLCSHVEFFQANLAHSEWPSKLSYYQRYEAEKNK